MFFFFSAFFFFFFNFAGLLMVFVFFPQDLIFSSGFLGVPGPGVSSEPFACEHNQGRY